MAHLQSQILIAEDVGGLARASSSFGARNNLKFEDMEESIWRHLPSCILLDTVLKSLPLMSNVRLRSVCREWYRVLSSYSPPPTQGICFFGALAEDSDRVENSVHKSLPRLQNGEDVSIHPNSFKIIKLDLSFLPKELQPCASGGGLLCFMRNHGKRRHLPAVCFWPKDFYICNPITRRYSQLPGKWKERLVPDQVDDEFVQVIYELTVDEFQNYKFFVGRFGNSLVKLHIYDSRSSSWTNLVTPEPPHPHNYLHWDLERVPVFQNGVLKVIDVQHLEPTEIEKNDLQLTRGRAFQVSDASSYRIVGTETALFAVEVVMSPEERLYLWRQDGNGWEVVSSLSFMAAKGLLQCFKDGQSVEQHLHCQMCWFNEDLLCIKLSKGQTHRVLTFHLKAKVWQPSWYAHLKGVDDQRPCNSMFSFAPSLKQIP